MKHLPMYFIFRCKCGKEYPDHIQLLAHRKIDNLTICELCQKPFPNCLAYRKHLETFHVSKQNRTFECKECEYSSHANRYLNKHIAKYHNPLNPPKRPWKPHYINTRCSDQSVIEKTQQKIFMKNYPEMNNDEKIIW